MNTTTIAGHTVTIDRDRDNALRASTVIPLGFDRREMRITTTKSIRGGIRSNANVVQVAEDGRSYSYAMFGDFSTQLEADKGMRCTEKNVLAMHSRALEGIADVLATARAFYKQPEAA